jgi:hypothetical protein
MDRLTVLFAATTVALGATTTWLGQKYFSEREHRQALAESVATLESALYQASDHDTPGSTSTPESGLGLSGTTTAPESSPTAPPLGGADALIARYRESETRLLQNEQYRERWLALTMLRLRQTYADLQRLLGLSDAEYESFLTTMAQFELEQTQRNLEAPLQTGLDPGERIAASREQRTQAEAARRQALRDALGDARYRQWADQQRTLPGRQELERWQGELARAGTPLTPEQAEDLLPILVEHQQRIAALPQPAALLGRALSTPSGSANALLELERRVDAQSDINAWFGDALTGLLTPAQRDLLTTTGNRDVELQRAELEISRFRFANP